jgi:UDP-N-acetylmuramate dehydrogenase
MLDWIEELGSVINARMKLHEPLAAHTSFKIGGPADVFAEIGNIEQLKKLVSFCRSAKASPIPLLIIGRGTNLLVSNKGVRGVVAQLCGDFAQVEKAGKPEGRKAGRPENWLSDCQASWLSGCPVVSVTAGAAVILSRLSRWTAEKGLAGLEFAFGIPGSLGGALVMNAGAESHSIGEIVDAVEAIAQDGSEVVVHRDELKFAYRWSNLSEYICVTKAYLRMRSSSPEETIERMKQIFQKKKAKQPLSAASAGCVFKNPAGISAGKLIDECGLKGAEIGGAQVSTQHANFIVNTGGATATDVLSLIDRVRSTVRERTGIDLELELKVVEYNG